MKIRTFFSEFLELSYAIALIVLIPLLVFYVGRILGVTSKSAFYLYAVCGLMNLVWCLYTEKNALAIGTLFAGIMLLIGALVPLGFAQYEFSLETVAALLSLFMGVGILYLACRRESDVIG